MGCKKCKHVFRVDMQDFEPESDGFCPKCDNEFFIEAKTPQTEGQLMISIEGDDGLMRDHREKVS